jgi:hypothetical protein
MILTTSQEIFIVLMLLLKLLLLWVDKFCIDTLDEPIVIDMIRVAYLFLLSSLITDRIIALSLMMVTTIFYNFR